MNKRMESSEDAQDPLDLLLSHRSPPRRSPRKGFGISPLDLLELPPTLSTAMNYVMRIGQATATQVAEFMHIDLDEALEVLDTLVARGHLRQISEGTEGAYKPVLGQSRRPRLSSRLWEMLEEEE